MPFLVVSGMLFLAASINLVALDSTDAFGSDDYRQLSTENDDEEDQQLLDSERPADSTSYGIKILLSSGLFLIPNILMIPVWSCMDFAIPFVGPYLEECEPGRASK